MKVLKSILDHFVCPNNIVPIEKKENDLEVDIVDLEDIKAIESIKKVTGFNILPRLATKNGIKNILRQYQENLETEINEMVIDNEENLKLVMKK